MTERTPVAEQLLIREQGMAILRPEARERLEHPEPGRTSRLAPVRSDGRPLAQAASRGVRAGLVRFLTFPYRLHAAFTFSP